MIYSVYVYKYLCVLVCWSDKHGYFFKYMAKYYSRKYIEMVVDFSFSNKAKTFLS